jgi:hypothetical protein
MIPQLLIAASGAVMLSLGSIHLLYTYMTLKLEPRELSTRTRMEQTKLVISSQTTVWRAWVGFNASHSTGAMFFGGIYVYLSLGQPAILFKSSFLVCAGTAMLLTYLALARLYWFKIPFTGILLATSLFAAGCISHWIS